MMTMGSLGLLIGKQIKTTKDYTIMNYSLTLILLLIVVMKFATAFTSSGEKSFTSVGNKDVDNSVSIPAIGYTKAPTDTLYLTEQDDLNFLSKENNENYND